MKKRKKIWLAGVLATLTIIGTAPASLATETETVTVAQEETVAAAETEVAETTQKNAEESTEAADKADTTAETDRNPPHPKIPARHPQRKLNPPLAKRLFSS